MGRVNRLLERRALRRAADQALLTTLGNPTPNDAGGRPDQDFKYNRAQPAETAAYDHEPTTDPIPVLGDVAPDDYGWPDEDDVPAAESVETPSAPVDVYDLVPDQPDEPEWDDATEVAAAEQPVSEPPDDYAWNTPSEVPPPDPAPVRPMLRARPVAEGAYVQPALDFTVTGSQPWYRTKPAAVVLVAAIMAAVVCGGWLVFRSPDSTAEQSTEAPTSAPPAPSTAAPTAASAPRQAPAPPRHLLLRLPRRRRPSPRIPRHSGSTRRVTPSRPRRRSRGSMSQGRR